ncbi:lipopolysaccharide biosynthesis protein [Crenothrix sp.]|uniref:lipopolysaccharide biosynthesis protein n=1 Tax=Crenothrix sp. TaxID=3100433 RepID=UPI00374D9807
MILKVKIIRVGKVTLKSRALSATVWSGADIFMRQGLQFGVSIALARLLSPEEFGTVALLYLFTDIAGAFVDSGFSSALVQRQEITHTDESTVFWFNLVMGELVALGLCAAAPVIATFFAIPILQPLTALLALNIFLSALGSIHGTLLTKRLDFRRQMEIGGFASLISGAIAIVMAWHGYGVWALVAQTLASTMVTTLLLWCYSSWRPAIVFSRKSVRQLFGFGGYMLASGLLDITYSRAYTLLIGSFFGVRELGFYNRADGTKQLPVGVLTSILARVSLPIFSTAAHDKAQLRRGVQLALRGMMLINVPMMLGLAATAESFVLTLFGVKWLPSVPLLQVLCLGAVFWPLHVINLNVLMAQGHSHLFFRLEVVKKLLGFALLVAGAFYGVMGIAWSQVVFGILAFAINAYYSKFFLDYGVFAQTCDFLAILFISIFMAVFVYCASTQVHLLAAVQLLALILTGLIIFVGLARVFRLTALRDVISLFQHRKDNLTAS